MRGLNVSVRALAKRLSTTIICTDATSLVPPRVAKAVARAYFNRPRGAGTAHTRIVRPTCKTAADALAESPLAGLFDRARKLGQLSSLVADVSREATGTGPGLIPRCAIQGKQVIISVATSSQAAKLRQRTTTLIGLLQDCDPELTGFRIRLQPGAPDGSGSTETLPARQEPPSTESVAAALRFAEDLSRNLDDSPLRRAAAQLRSLLRKRLSGGR
jgi:hypothetical protein